MTLKPLLLGGWLALLVPALAPAQSMEDLAGFQKLLDGLLLQSFKDLQALSGQVAGSLDDREAVARALAELEKAYPPEVGTALLTRAGGLFRVEDRPSFAGFKGRLDAGWWKRFDGMPGKTLHALDTGAKGEGDYAVLHPVKQQGKTVGAVGLVFTLEELLSAALKLHKPFQGLSVQLRRTADDPPFVQQGPPLAPGVVASLVHGKQAASGIHRFIQDHPPRLSSLAYAWSPLRLYNVECLAWIGKSGAGKPAEDSLSGTWTGALTQNRYGAERKQRGGTLDVLFHADGGKMEILFPGDAGSRVLRGLMRENEFIAWADDDPSLPGKPAFIAGSWEKEKNALKGSLYEAVNDEVVKSTFYLLKME